MVLLGGKVLEEMALLVGGIFISQNIGRLARSWTRYDRYSDVS